MQYKSRLQSLKKDTLSMTGHSISDDDQITHILKDLGREYDLVVVAVSAKLGQWSAMEVHSLLHTFEGRIESNRSIGFNSDGSQPSLNFAGVQRGGFTLIEAEEGPSTLEEVIILVEDRGGFQF